MDNVKLKRKKNISSQTLFHLCEKDNISIIDRNLLKMIIFQVFLYIKFKINLRNTI